MLQICQWRNSLHQSSIDVSPHNTDRCFEIENFQSPSDIQIKALVSSKNESTLSTKYLMALNGLKPRKEI